MAVDQQGLVKLFNGGVDQVFQGLMIREIITLNPGLGLGKLHSVAIYLLVFTDIAGNGAKTADDPQGFGFSIGGQRVDEHFGIQLPRGAVDIKVGAWKICFQQGATEIGHSPEKLVNKTVFGVAQGQRFKAGCRDKTLAVLIT